MTRIHLGTVYSHDVAQAVVVGFELRRSSGVRCGGGSARQIRSRPTPLSMTLWRVSASNSALVWIMPLPGDTTRIDWPVLCGGVVGGGG